MDGPLHDSTGLPKTGLPGHMTGLGLTLSFSHRLMHSILGNVQLLFCQKSQPTGGSDRCQNSYNYQNYKDFQQGKPYGIFCMPQSGSFTETLLHSIPPCLSVLAFNSSLTPTLDRHRSL